MELAIGQTIYWIDWEDGVPLLKEGRVVDLDKIYMNKVGVTCEYPGSYPLILTTNFVYLVAPAAIKAEIRFARRELGAVMEKERDLLELLFGYLGLGGFDD